MRIATPSTGLLAVALTGGAFAVPLAAAGPASAACLAQTLIQISDHERVFDLVPGTKITFTQPGTHTVEITKATTLSARYNTTNVADQQAIRKAVMAAYPRTRAQVSVTTGHKVQFDSGRGQRVTVQYASRGDRVKWTKLDVHPDCTSTVLDTGHAKFPRNNLNWVFAVAVA